MQTLPADLGRLDRGNPPTTALRRGALESGLLARRRLLLLHFHLQHWIQDALHFQGFKPMIDILKDKKEMRKLRPLSLNKFIRRSS